MTELHPTTPHETATPGASGPGRLSVGTTNCVEVDLGAMWSLAPYSGRAQELSERLVSTHGVAFPEPNRRVPGDHGVEALWFGRELALLIGAAPDPALSEIAAVTDQSDAWCTVELTGAGVEDVLARLVPIDLRRANFGTTHTARTLLGHMSASITRTSPDQFRIMVFRSMARSLFRELHHAMIGVSLRNGDISSG